MTKSLLFDRFRLSVHLEDKEVPVYALVVGKREPKLIPGKPSSSAECKFHLIEGSRTYVCQNMTMRGLAERLRDVAPAYLDRPVVDLTNLNAGYNFSLSWVSRSQAMPAFQPGVGKSGTLDGPTVFQAFSQQLGLELASTKRPLPSVVIDHVDPLN